MRAFVKTFLFLPLLSFGQTDSIDIITNSYLDLESANPVSSILLYIETTDLPYIYNKRLAITDQSDITDCQFRIASSTKLFVSAIILQLAEEGKLRLNDKAVQHLNHLDYLDFDNFHVFEGEKYSHEITIEQLLSHRTGISDIFSDREEEFFDALLENPNKQYSPKTIVDLYFQYRLNESPHFKPNTGWYYSDMNYVLLGLIVQSIDQQPLHQSIRTRILDPLEMSNTFFEFYEQPSHPGKLQNQYVGSINFSELNTSFDWAGGGLVSTNTDLAIFIQALFTHRLISRKSLKQMINVADTREGENRYGLGIYESIYNGSVFFGHYGFYGTYIGYCPKDKTTLSYSINQAMPDFDVYRLISNILRRIQ